MARAETLHILGACDGALADADTALTRWQPTDDRDRHTCGSDLLMRYLQLTDDCGDTDRARRLLTAPRDLLPPPGHVSREIHVLFVRTRFGDPQVIPGHRLVCNNHPPDERLRDISGEQITAVRGLVLHALGDTPDAGFPGLHELVNPHHITGRADGVVPIERKS